MGWFRGWSSRGSLGNDIINACTKKENIYIYINIKYILYKQIIKNKLRAKNVLKNYSKNIRSGLVTTSGGIRSLFCIRTLSRVGVS